MNVKITIEYIGNYKKSSDVDFETLFVDCEIKKAHKFISKYIADKYGIKPPYSIIVGGTHIIGAINKNIKVEEGDVFVIVPFLSGG